MKLTNICDKIKEAIAQEPEVLAIFNNGSAVIGIGDPSSDVDFVVILRKEKDSEKILRILRNSFKVIKNKENPEIDVEEQFSVLGRRADFSFTSKKSIENKVNTFYNSKENFLESQHILQHKIIDAISIYDPQNLLKVYQKKIKKYPKNILDVVVKDSLKLIKEELFYWRYHGFRNEFQFAFKQWEVIGLICQVIYAKNKRLFMLPYKRLHNDLKKLKPNIEKEMYSLIRGKNTKKMINKKIRIVEKILEKLEKLR